MTVSVMGFGNTQKQLAISLVRMLWPFGALNDRGEFKCEYVDPKTVQQMIQEGRSQELEGRDLYVLCRAHGPGNNPFGKEQARGAKTIYETDDDLLGETRDFGFGPFVENTVQFVDALTVSTPELGVRMAQLGKRVYVLPNHLNTEFYRKTSMEAKRLDPRLTIGLAGTRTHWGDWIFVKEPLMRIAKEHPEVRIVCGGYLPEYLKEIPGIQQLPEVSILNYPGMLAQMDIRLCPLDPDDEFNESKSCIAALEAMAAARKSAHGTVTGAVPICCKELPMYKRVIKHRKNGMLAARDEWYEVISEVIEDEHLRRKMAKAGPAWVKANRDIRRGAQLWAAAYREILS